MSAKRSLFIIISLSAIVAVFLAACGPAATPEPELVEVTVIVAGTPVVEFITASPEAPVEAGELVIVSWGGSFQDAQREAYWGPFSEETGVVITEDTGPQIDRSMAAVQSGNIEYDITATNPTFYMIGVENDLWEPIDYSYFDEETLAQLPDWAKLEYGVAEIVYSRILSYDKRAFPDGTSHPTTWAEFWDVETFPGMRTLPTCSMPASVPEIALLADGVPPEEVYPIDIDRAIDKLRELKPYVIWHNTEAHGVQLLVDQEAVFGYNANGRVQVLIDAGVNLGIEWGQALWKFDIWYVLKGAPNKDNAMKLIAYASQPVPQAEMARLTGYSPTNSVALDLLDEAAKVKLTTYAPNFELHSLNIQDSWWKEHRQEWEEACTAFLLE